MIAQSFQWIRSKFWSILLSLLLALTVWVTANQEENPVEERTLATPVTIEIVGLSEGMVITNEYPTETRLRLRAQTDTWPSLSAEDLVVQADMTGLGPGTHQVELATQVFARAVVVSSNPAQIRVVIEEHVTAEMPVTVVLQGRPPIGYRTGAAQVDPSTVIVQGPESSINAVDEIRVTIPVQDRRDPVDDAFVLEAYNEDGDLVPNVTFRTPSINVIVPITQVAGFKDVAVRVATTGQPDRGYFVTGPSVTPSIVTLQGDPAVIDALPPLVETQPIDLTGLTDDLIIETSLVLPDGVTAEPESVEVIISIAAQQGGRSLVVPVSVLNLEDGFEAQLSATEVEVFLSGPLPVLDDLTAEDLVVTVDAAGLEIGTFTAEPVVTLAANSVLIESILPPTIDINILPEGLNGSS